MNDVNLFGEFADVAEPKTTATIKLGLETGQGWVSYYYKTCRIACASQAVIAAEVIRQGQGDYRVALLLSQLIGEDVHPLYYQKLMPHILAHIELVRSKIIKKHNVWQLSYMLAKAPKWYMDNVIADGLKDEDIWQGKELEDIRQNINVKLNLGDPNTCSEFAENYDFPSWVWDRHTAKGYKMAVHKTANLTLDGKWDNRYAIKKRWDEVYEANKGKPYNEILKEWHSLFKRT